MPPEPVVELLLVSVDATALGPRQRVHLGILVDIGGLSVEVGHVPPVLFVVVVMGIGTKTNKALKIKPIVQQNSLDFYVKVVFS